MSTIAQWKEFDGEDPSDFTSDKDVRKHLTETLSIMISQDPNFLSEVGTTDVNEIYDKLLNDLQYGEKIKISQVGGDIYFVAQGCATKKCTTKNGGFIGAGGRDGRIGITFVAIQTERGVIHTSSQLLPPQFDQAFLNWSSHFSDQEIAKNNVSSFGELKAKILGVFHSEPPPVSLTSPNEPGDSSPILPPPTEAPSPGQQVASVSSQGRQQANVEPMSTTPVPAPVAPATPVTEAPLPHPFEEKQIIDSGHRAPPKQPCANFERDVDVDGTAQADEANTTACDNGKRNLQRVRDNLLGTWHGYYICGQGQTGTEISLKEMTEGGNIRGTFKFFNRPGMRNALPGSYAVSGHYNSAAKSLRLDPAGWIDQPQGYTAVPIMFQSIGDWTKLEGKILDARCSVIVLSK